jgi:hypothetical protein
MIERWPAASSSLGAWLNGPRDAMLVPRRLFEVLAPQAAKPVQELQTAKRRSKIRGVFS